MYKVNDQNFVPATTTGVTLSLTSETATLNDGTVKVDGDEVDAPSATTLTGSATVTASDSTIVHVTAESGNLKTIGDIDADEIFQIAGTTDADGVYRRTRAGLFFSTDNGDNYESEVTVGFSSTTLTVDEGLTFRGYLQLTTDTVLDLSSFTFTTDTSVYSDDLDKKIAIIKQDENDQYILDPEAGSFNNDIDLIKLGSSFRAINTRTFTADVQTAEGATSDSTITYTINGNDYVATSQITVEVINSSTTKLSEGSVQINSATSTVVLSGNDKISYDSNSSDSVIVGLDSNSNVVISGIGSDKSDKFTISNSEYEGIYSATNLGLFRTDLNGNEPKLLTSSADNEDLKANKFVLDFTPLTDDDWSEVTIINGQPNSDTITIDSSYIQTYVDESMSNIVARYTPASDTSNAKLTAGSGIGNVKNINVDGIVVEFSDGDFSSATFTLNDTVTVSDVVSSGTFLPSVCFPA